ncbi:MAG: AAA family ATPase [Clostridia bacterium]|nr:AAA family ATPase [Clostridia bacterium]
MRIDKINITEFGGLKSRSFSLQNGINVFEGRNEAGKSTVVAFIRFMLYGMPKKTASQELSDRDKGLSWDNQNAEGSMEITIPEGQFRIERKYQLKGSTSRDAIDECKIIDLATGSPVNEKDLPKKLFMGISPEVYDSTSCIRQLECSNIDGNSVRSSIENLLLSADEKIDTKKAQDSLDKFRRIFLHKNAKGGQIYELEAQKAELADVLRKAKEDAEVIIPTENAIAHLKELEETHSKNEAYTEEKIKTYENCVVLKRFEELHAEEEKINSLNAEIQELTAKRGFFGTLPSREVTEDLDASERALSEAASNLGVAQKELSAAETSSCGDRILAELHKKIENGKKDNIIQNILKLFKKRKNAVTASLFFYIFGGLVVLLGAFGLVAPILFSEPSFISNLLTFIPTQYTVAVFSALTAVGVVLLTLGIVKSVAVSKRTKERIELFSQYGLKTQTATLEEFEKHAEKCRENYALCVEHDERFDAASGALSAAKKAFEERMEQALNLLSETDTPVTEKKPNAVCELLKNRCSDFREVCAEKDRLYLELQASKNMLSSIRRSLESYSEQDLRSRVPEDVDVVAVVGNTDISDLRRRYEFSKVQHDVAMQKRVSLEKELIALTAKAQDPAKLESEYGDVCKKLADCRQNYNALVMAIKAIDTASDTIRKNVTPTIRKHAGDLMGKLTAGKYSDIGLSADFDISVNVEGANKPIDALSKGTRDAAYITLRMALVALICSENPPPLTFDESFSLLDDVRTQNMLTMLYAYTQHGGQCLLFTCHKREPELLKSIGNFNHIIL